MVEEEWDEHLGRAEGRVCGLAGGLTRAPIVTEADMVPVSETIPEDMPFMAQ